jgi:hypothetical protein
MIATRLAALLAPFALLAPAAAPAAPPDACSIVTIEEVNSLVGGTATRVSPRRAGNPSECAFEDSRRAALLVLTLREVQYAAENELQYERENLEKIYRGKVKWIDGVGERAFWFEANKSGMFRKGKILVTVRFARPKNATEVDTMQLARLVESRLR